jgi:hypothetical protein
MLAVASYYYIRCILVMSMCIEPGLWESHISILECSWARSVWKLYDYSEVILWIMSPLAGRDYTGTTSYIVRGEVRCSFIPCWVWRQWTCICIAFASLSLWVLKFYVGLKVDLMSIVSFIRGDGLFTIYHVLYFIKILLDILHNVFYFFMESHGINNLIINIFLMLLYI